MAVNRALLQQELQRAQNISQSAATGQGFDPRGGYGVLAAQLATAGLGAYAQNRAQKKLAALDLQEQQQFSQANPEFADIAAVLGSEGRKQLALKKALLKQEKALSTPQPLSKEGKLAFDIKRGLVPEGTKPSALVEVNTASEKQEQKELGKIFAKAYQDIAQSGQTARRGLETLQTLEQAVKNPDAAQGAFAGIRSEAKKIADLFDIETKGLEDDAIISAVGNKLALQLRNPKGEDGGLTGATSDRDIKFLVAGVPNRDKTREQNLALIEIAKRDKERTIKLKNLADQYLEENGTFKGFEKVKERFYEENPLFEEDSEDKENIKALLKNEKSIDSVDNVQAETEEQTQPAIKFLGFEE